MNTHDIETTRKWLQQQPVISIIPHKNPDGDAIGSCLGLCLYLRQNSNRGFYTYFHA